MDQYIEGFGKLQSLVESMGLDQSISFPQIVVVGGQSDGKSSVLESIAGHSFLPRGQNTVTRTPIKVVMRSKDQVQQITVSYESGKIDETGHPLVYRRQLDDFADVAAEITRATDTLTGGKRIIVSKLITVEVVSPTVPNLTLIDLPGRIERVREDQIIYSEIEALIEKYLENPQAIILVVHQAGNDIETSRGLSAANKVDPHGLRTICVLTKLDLVGKEDDITDRLAGKSNHDDSRIKCRRVIGVVNTPLPRTDGIMQDRAQLLAAQVAAENAFFQQRKYTALAGNHGTKNLVSYLSTVFVEHLKGSLPQLRIDLDNLKVKLEDHIHRLGPVNFKQYTYTHNPFSNGEFEYVISVIDRFCHTLIESINGRIYLGSRQVRGGALLEQRFNTLYRNSLDNIDPLGDMSTAETWSKIKMAGGLTAQMFLNETAFELLTKKEIARMKSESINCAVGAHTEVLRICQEAAKESIKDVRITYPALYQAILDEVNDFLSEKLKKTKKMVIHGVEMHWDYINVKNRHFALKKDEVIGDRLLTATHQTDIVDQEPQSRILTSTGPLQLDMARMSEEEEKECMMYASLVRNYFDITRDTICDTVPKIVVRFMVKEVERQIRRHLTGRLGVEQIYSKLLVLSESVALRRREAGAKLKQYEQAVQMARELAIS